MSSRAVALTAVLVASSLTACGGSDGGRTAAVSRRTHGTTTSSRSAASVAPADPRVRAAIAKGVGYAASRFDGVDPHSLMVFDYLARRWGLTALAGAGRLARRRAAGSVRDDPLVRLIFPGRHAGFETIAPITGTDRLIAVALECDHGGYGDGYAADMRAAVAAGGLDLTHAALALQMSHELGCPSPVAASERVDLIAALRDAVAAGPPADDLGLEEAAMLCYLGEARSVPHELVERTIAAQRADGGWAARMGSTESSWHATGLALWVLSATATPGADVNLVRPS